MKFNKITESQEAQLRMKPRSTKSLVGIDGNAFSIVGHMKRQLEKVGWTTEEVDIVIAEMFSGDYDHLLSVACEFTDAGGWGEDDGED